MSNTPGYYIGKIFKYHAADIIEDFNLSYNIGSVCSYILRAGNKSSKAMDSKDKQIDDYTKAIAHLNLEIARLGRVKGDDIGKMSKKEFNDYLKNKRDGRNE